MNNQNWARVLTCGDRIYAVAGTECKRQVLYAAGKNIVISAGHAGKKIQDMTNSKFGNERVLPCVLAHYAARACPGETTYVAGMNQQKDGFEVWKAAEGSISRVNTESIPGNLAIDIRISDPFQIYRDLVGFLFRGFSASYSQFGIADKNGSGLAVPKNFPFLGIPDNYAGSVNQLSVHRAELGGRIHSMLDKYARGRTKLAEDDLLCLFGQLPMVGYAPEAVSIPSLEKKIIMNCANLERMPADFRRRALAGISESVSRNYDTNAIALKWLPFVMMNCKADDCRHVVREFKSAKAAGLYSALGDDFKLEAFESVEIELPKPRIKQIINRPRKNILWNLEMVGAYEARKQTMGDGAVIAIIDTGADCKHPDLERRICSAGGYDFVRGTPEVHDGNGHGTHVAGTVCGELTGVAPGAKFAPLKVLSDDGWGSDADIILALDWALDKRINVASMSLGSPDSHAMLEKALKAANGLGMTIVAAAGNEGYGPSYPATYEFVISTAAVDRNKNHADFSNIHDSVNISAPGVDVESCWPGGKYAELSGTSMATPHTSGTIALMKSLKPEITDAEIKEALFKAAEEIGDGDDDKDMFGAGLLRADSALKVI
jgi:hypothetical protein